MANIVHYEANEVLWLKFNKPLRVSLLNEYYICICLYDWEHKHIYNYNYVYVYNDCYCHLFSLQCDGVL